MAKKSKVVKNQQRIAYVAKVAGLRKELKVIIHNRDLSFEERYAAQERLGGLRRDGSATRIRNRCSLTGRARGVYRKFQLSRIALRDLAHWGYIPGMTKSSW